MPLLPYTSGSIEYVINGLFYYDTPSASFTMT